MRKIIHFIIPIAICFIVGLTASYFQSDSISSWYPTLNKPSLTPPNIAFPIAWSIIYLLMGISIGLILNSDYKKKGVLIVLFAVQLFFNFTWSIVFFYMQNPLLGLINIIILDILIIYYVIKSSRINSISAWLFTPYLLWILFATYLNGYISYYN